MTVLFPVLTVMMEGRKTSCSPPAAARGGAIHSAPLENLGSAGCQPAIVGSLSTMLCLASCQTPQASCLRSPNGSRQVPNNAYAYIPLRSLKRPRTCCLFFESTLHVSRDQQLSALQPLTK